MRALPQGWRTARKSPDSKGSDDVGRIDPVFAHGSRDVRTSDQIKTRLLCRDCEQRFHRFGEDWTLRHCFRATGTFNILRMLHQSTSFETRADRTVWYRVSDVARLNAGALEYFAISVLWRASAARRNGVDGQPLAQIDCGNRYSEVMRAYLLGNVNRVDELCIHVRVNDDPRGIGDRLILLPLLIERSGFWHYRFLIPGLAFDLFLGQRVLDFPNLKGQFEG